MRKYAVTLGLFAVAITIFSVIMAIPPPDDFNPDNPYWNGLSRLSSELNLRYLDSVIDERLLVEPSKYALLIIGPEKEFKEAEAVFIQSFIERGGTVILMDEFGSGNSLLQLLKVTPRFNGSLLLDPLFKEKAAAFPRIRVPSMNLSDVVANYATVIDDCEKPIGYSSYYSFLDTNSNGVWDEGEPKGPLVVGCEIPIGRGELIIFSDSSIGINSMLSMGSGLDFFKSLFRNREGFVDRSHWELSRFSVIRGWLISASSFFSQVEIRYAVIVGAVLLIVKFRLRKVFDTKEDEVDKVLMRNPTWNKELLEKLWREMRIER